MASVTDKEIYDIVVVGGGDDGDDDDAGDVRHLFACCGTGHSNTMNEAQAAATAAPRRRLCFCSFPFSHADAAAHATTAAPATTAVKRLARRQAEPRLTSMLSSMHTSPARNEPGSHPAARNKAKPSSISAMRGTAGGLPTCSESRGLHKPNASIFGRLFTSLLTSLID